MPLWHVIALGAIGFLFAGAFVIAPYWDARQTHIRAGWPVVSGKAFSTRVVKKAPSSMYFPYTMYRGECQVQYRVAGKQYAVWTSSGYSDPDPHFISDKVESCLNTPYVVHYNPENPAEAFPDRVEY